MARERRRGQGAMHLPRGIKTGRGSQSSMTPARWDMAGKAKCREPRGGDEPSWPVQGTGCPGAVLSDVLVTGLPSHQTSDLFGIPCIQLGSL